MLNIKYIADSAVDIDGKRIILSGEVSGDMYDHITASLLMIADKEINSNDLEYKKKPVTILLSTYGGDVYFGLAIYDIIRYMVPDCTIIASGPVMSAGALILQAGKTRQMLPNSHIMIHFGMEVNTDAATQAQHGRITQTMKKIISERVVVKEKAVKEWFKKESYFDTKRALESGLVDELLEYSHE